MLEIFKNETQKRTVLIATIAIANCANEIEEKRNVFPVRRVEDGWERAIETLIYNQFDVDIMIFALFWVLPLLMIQ